MFSHHLCFSEGRYLQIIASFFGDTVPQTIWFVGERCIPFFFRSKSEECPMSARTIFWHVREHLKNYICRSLQCLFGTNRRLSTSPSRWSDPWYLSSEQWVLFASCFGLQERASTWCDLGRSSPSSWEQTFYGQTTKPSCCLWNQVVSGHCEIAEEDKEGKKSKRHSPDMSWTCGSILNHTRWNIACAKCAVCTSRRLHGNCCCLWMKTRKIVLNAPSFQRSRHCSSAILQNSGKFHSPLLPSCSWPPRIGRWRSWSGKLPPIFPTWTLIDKERIKIPCAWCMLIGWTCCGVTCGNFILLLELLPWALSDLKIGSNSDTALVSNFNCVLLLFETKTTNDCGRSAPDWIGAVAFPWLFRLIVHASSYRALFHHVLRVVLSCQFVHLLATFFGPSCVNLRIATRFLDLESINHRCALLLRLFPNFFGLDRVLSYLLMHHAVLAGFAPL